MSCNEYWLGRSVPKLSVAILVGLLVFGIDNTFGQLSRNGFSEYISSTLAGHGPQYLPDTGDVLVTRYVRIPFIDRLCIRANILLSGFATQLHPEVTLYCLSHCGDLVAGCLLLVIESHRKGNAHHVLSLTGLWLTLIILFDFASITPIFAIIHLLKMSRSRDLSSAVHLNDPFKLVAVVPALFPGLILPLILTVSPFRDASFRQWLMALCMLFPLYLGFWQFLAAKVLRRMHAGQYVGARQAEIDSAALRIVYDFALGIATFTQILSYAILYVTRLSFARVYIPAVPHQVDPWASGAQIMHEFYKYDHLVGSLVGVVWATTLLGGFCPDAFAKAQRARTVMHMAGRTLISGPVGVTLWLMRQRDESVLAEELARME